MGPTNPVSHPNGKAIGCLLVVVCVAILLGLLFPAVTGPRTGSPTRAQAKAAVGQLAGALKQYHVEYGKWPDFSGDGAFLETARNAQLLRVLTAKDESNNPRKMAFFEYPVANPRGSSEKGRAGGIDSVTGALLDPWGNPYRIMLDTDGDGAVASPYPRDPDRVIRSSVIVWSLGKDGQQAEFTKAGNQVSDDIISWQ